MYLKSMECQEDHQNQLTKVRKNRKIKQKISENSTLKQDPNKISTSERERESLQKPFDIEFLLVMKCQPFSDVSELISYKKCIESNLASVLKIFVPNSLV